MKIWKFTLLVSVCAMTLCFSSAQGQSCSFLQNPVFPNRSIELKESKTTFEQLPISAQNSIQEALVKHNPDFAFKPTKDGYTAGIAQISEKGMKLQSGTNAVSLSLQSFGYPSAMQSVPQTELRAEANRLERRLGTMEEWYVHSRRGVQQGFTLSERPLGQQAGEALHVVLAMDLPKASWKSVISPDNRSVSWQDERGKAQMSYTGLVAFDATGKTFPAWMEMSGNELRLLVNEEAAQYPLTIDPYVQQAYLKASNTEANDQFGTLVSISGDTIVVGTPSEGSNATGINGDQTNNLERGSGAVYVFVRSGGVWSQEAYLKASNTETGDQFGEAVSISGDTIVVGAPSEDSNATGVGGTQSDNSALNAGAAYVFVRSGGVWTQEAYLKASNTQAGDHFGSAVAISGDTIVVTATSEDSNATGVGGTQSDNSATDSGAAYVFIRSGGVWSQEAYLKASNTETNDYFGYSVSISGDTIVMQAPHEDSSATGINGNESDNSVSNAGAAYVFVRSGGVWSQEAYLKASNTEADDQFGTSVSISGDTIVAAAPYEDSSATGVGGTQSDNSALNAGAAYVFVRSGGVWTQEAYLKASNTQAGDFFGSAAAISGDMIVVGAPSEDSNATGVGGSQSDNSADFAGAAYAFVRSGGVWSQQAYLKASNTEDDSFSWTVAISGDTIVVGTPYESSNATGIDGNQLNNSMSSAGAAYVFWDDPSALPISLVSTSASLSGQDATLKWQTASESNNERFVIEEQIGNTWKQVGEVKGAGTTTLAQNYSFTIPNLAYGSHSFRIAQHDYDGTRTYSDPISLQVELSSKFALSDAYPNPFNPSTNFTLAISHDQRVQIEVFDLLGRKVQTLHHGQLAGQKTHTFTFNGNGLASGNYFVRIVGETFVSTKMLTMAK
jgi:hypothetical protein